MYPIEKKIPKEIHCIDHWLSDKKKYSMGCGVSQFYINVQFEPKNGFSNTKNHNVYVPLNKNKTFLQQSKVRLS